MSKRLLAGVLPALLERARSLYGAGATLDYIGKDTGLALSVVRAAIAGVKPRKVSIPDPVRAAEAVRRWKESGQGHDAQWEIARDMGVSQETMSRWIRAYRHMAWVESLLPECPVCGRKFRPSDKAGMRQRYCTDAHKRKAENRRWYLAHREQRIADALRRKRAKKAAPPDRVTLIEQARAAGAAWRDECLRDGVDVDMDVPSGDTLHAAMDWSAAIDAYDDELIRAFEEGIFGRT